MFAMTNRLPVGVFLWSLFGLAIGYAVAILGGRRGSSAMLTILGGLIGGVGVVLGLGLNGYRLMECNLAAAPGGLLFSVAAQRLSRPRPA